MRGGDIEIGTETRENHWYIIGASQSGKTTFLKNLIVKDMKAGRGLCLIDMHGDAARELTCCVPRSRIDDVIYFNPASRASPAFNFLLLPFPAAELALDIGDLFEEIAEGWGPRLGQVITFGLLTLILDAQDNGRLRTFSDMRPLLTNPNFREDVLSGIQLPALLDFWQNEYPRIQNQVLNPVMNKFRRFLLPGSISEKVFSQPENELNFSEIMQKGKILLVNLSKGALGESSAVLLGSVITRFIQLAALARQKIPRPKRTPFFFYVDEFQNFASSPFESIIEETMKFRVFLRLAHHRLSQLEYNLFTAIATSFQVFVSFRLNRKDAAHLQQEMHWVRDLFRIRETGFDIPAKKFVEIARAYFTQKYADYTARIDNPGDLPVVFNRASFWDTSIRDDIGRVLNVLSQRNVPPAAVKEVVEKSFGKNDFLKKIIGEDNSVRLFPDVEYRREEYPKAEDFAKLEPKKEAFIRVKYAGKVFKFEPEPPPTLDLSVRKAILKKNKERYEARMKSRDTQEQQKSDPPPSPPPKQHKKKPRTEDDFLYKP